MKRFLISILLIILSLSVNAKNKLSGEVFSVLEQNQGWAYKFGEITETETFNAHYTIYDSKGRKLLEYRNDRIWNFRNKSTHPKLFVYSYDEDDIKIKSFKLYLLKDNSPELVDAEKLRLFYVKQLTNIPYLDYIYEYKSGELKSISVYKGGSLVLKEKYIIKLKNNGYRMCTRYRGDGSFKEEIPLLDNPDWSLFRELYSSDDWACNCYEFYSEFGNVLYDYCQEVLAQKNQYLCQPIANSCDAKGNWTSCKMWSRVKVDESFIGWRRRVIHYSDVDECIVGEEYLSKIDIQKLHAEEELMLEKELRKKRENEEQWRKEHPFPKYCGEKGDLDVYVTKEWENDAIWLDARIQKLLKKRNMELYVSIPFTVTRDGQVLRYQSDEGKIVHGWLYGPSSIVKSVDDNLCKSLYNALWNVVKKSQWSCGECNKNDLAVVSIRYSHKNLDEERLAAEQNYQKPWNLKYNVIYPQAIETISLIKSSYSTVYKLIQNENFHSILQNSDAKILNIKRGTRSVTSDIHNIYFTEATGEKINEEKIQEAMNAWIINNCVNLNEETVEGNSDDSETIPFQLVEEKPSFQGGDANKFSKWVGQNLVYPQIAKENGIQGRVTLQFTVETNGKITNVKVLRGIDPSLDKEAVRVVSSSPAWKPGRNKGDVVRVTYTFPVIFQLR